MNKDSKIYIAGHTGLAGSAIHAQLESAGYTNIITRTHKELDLTNQADVWRFFLDTQPEYVVLAAAKVGGVLPNSLYPAEFLGINLKIQTNVIDTAYRIGTKRLIFLASSCVYPRIVDRKIVEEDLLSAPLEPTNQWYATAKIAGIKMCQAYHAQYGFDTICLMPPNLYGPRDNFDPKTGHVLGALIYQFHHAKVNGLPEVKIWGTGNAVREFMYSGDLGQLTQKVLEMEYGIPEDRILNIGPGAGVTIAYLANLIKQEIEYEGAIVFDTTKPEGTPQKVMSPARIGKLGWGPEIRLEEGIHLTYRRYLQNL